MKFSGSFPTYTIFICKFKSVCFLFMKRSQFTCWRHLNSIRRLSTYFDYDYCFNLHFLILCDIWSTVENYFRKILSSPPEKIHFPLFTLPPLKIQKVQVPPFCQHWKFFWRGGAQDTMHIHNKILQDYKSDCLVWLAIYIALKTLSYLFMCIFWTKAKKESIT